MEVFIPALKSINPFFDEIISYSKNTFVFDDFKSYNSSFKTVLIHWPEQLFKWKEPTEEDLVKLIEAIKLWKQHAKILYVVHNLERHYGMTPQFRALYDLVESSCDKMIHFGGVSKELMQNKYPLKQHSIIFHPLYKKSYRIYEKQYAREELGIDENALVIFVPGIIRDNEESKMVIKAFKAINKKNKVLLASRILKKEFSQDFKGRTFLKKHLKIDVKGIYENYVDGLYKKPQYYFNYNFLELDEFSLMLSTADIVFIPRKKILNTGNVFLGMTFKKIIIGPDRGNLTEVLQKLKMPLFNPDDSNSIQKALQKAIEIFESKAYNYDDNILKEYDPAILAEQWDEVLN